MSRLRTLSVAALALVALPAAVLEPTPSDAVPASAASSVAPRTASAAGGDVVTVSSDHTVAAAIEFSQLTFGDGAAAEALLARADLFADALTGGGLAGDRPLLLTPSDRLHDAVARELGRLGTTEVLVLGGPNAVEPAVLEQLAARGISARRVYGTDRIRTAVAIAEVVRAEHAPTTAILARGFPSPGAHPTQAFADSMAAGAWAASKGWPILLSHTDRLSDATRSHLASAGYERVILVGGTGALSTQVKADAAAVVPRVDRVHGSSREETAVAIAKARGGTGDQVVVVDGHDPNAWAVGLPAASFGAKHNAPVLLARADGLPGPTRDFLVDAGTSSAICAAGTSTCTELDHFFNPPGIACGTEFSHWGIRGCHTEVAGLDTKFFPLHDERRPRRLAVYFHGDGANEYYENWGFDYTILDWAQRHDTMVVGFVSPVNRSGGRPSWGLGSHDLADQAAAVIETFLSRFGVPERRSLYWSTSGGSWYLAGYFVPLKGDTLPGLYAMSCGGSYPSDRDWAWHPETNTTARGQTVLFFNYGSEDFLADGSAAAERRYRERGFATEKLVHQGAEHCRHPIPQPTVDFWDKHVG